MGNPVVHFEVTGPDPGTLCDFYTGVFPLSPRQKVGLSTSLALFCDPEGNVIGLVED